MSQTTVARELALLTGFEAVARLLSTHSFACAPAETQQGSRQYALRTLSVSISLGITLSIIFVKRKSTSRSRSIGSKCFLQAGGSSGA